MKNRQRTRKSSITNFITGITIPVVAMVIFNAFTSIILGLVEVAESAYQLGYRLGSSVE